MELHRRSFIKAVTWRFLATLTTFSLVYYFTGKLELSIQVGILEVILKMAIYYGHERAWNRIPYGQIKKH